MPLKKGCDLKSFKSNIDKMRYEKGGPHTPPDKQSLAIAYSQLRKSCGIPRKAKQMTPSEIVAAKRKKTMEEIRLQHSNDDINIALQAANEVISKSISLFN